MAQTVRRLHFEPADLPDLARPRRTIWANCGARFDFLIPGFLGAAAGFWTRFRTPIEKGGTRNGIRRWPNVSGAVSSAGLDEGRGDFRLAAAHGNY